MQSHGTIYVIEDDVSLKNAVGRSFEAAGFHARLFASAEALLSDDALAAADCFVLDIHLPGISGFDLCRTLHNRGMRTPVILITAHDDPFHRRTADEVGAAAYFTKPFSSFALIEAVLRALGQRVGRSSHDTD